MSRTQMLRSFSSSARAAFVQPCARIAKPLSAQASRFNERRKQAMKWKEIDGFSPLLVSSLSKEGDPRMEFLTAIHIHKYNKDYNQMFHMLEFLCSDIVAKPRREVSSWDEIVLKSFLHHTSNPEYGYDVVTSSNPRLLERVNNSIATKNDYLKSLLADGPNWRHMGQTSTGMPSRKINRTYFSRSRALSSLSLASNGTFATTHDRTTNDRTTTRNLSTLMINDRTINDRTINDRTINDRTINDRIINDRSFNDRTINDRFVNDRSFNNRSFNDRSFNDRQIIND